MYSLKRLVIHLAATTLLLGQMLSATAASNDDIEREFNVQPGGGLILNSDSGSIEVRTWSEARVRVVVRNPGNFEVSIEQSGNEIIVQADRERGRSRIRFEIQVPDEFDVELDTGGGGITIEDISGNILAETSGGNITIGTVLVGNVSVDTSGGSIVIDDVSDGNITAETSGGRITINNVNGDVFADTSGGNIIVGDVTGDVLAETSGGNITVGDISGDVELDTSGGTIRSGYASGTLTAETSGGNIYLAGSDSFIDADTSGGNITIIRSGGPVIAHTSGGNIIIGPVQGFIEADTSGGSIKAELGNIEGRQNSHVDLNSSGGDIELLIPASHRADVSVRIEVSRRARGDYRIYTDFPLTISGQDERVVIGRGEINGGGDTINIETTNGDIRIISTDN